MASTARTGEYSSALESACANGDLDRAKSLYNDAIEGCPSACVSLVTRMAITSARNAHPNILSFCFASGLRERKFNFNDEILYAACSSSSIPIFQVLLDEGGLDVNHWLEACGDILKAAVDHGNIELVKYLFSKGADPNSDRCAPHGDDIAIICAITLDINRDSMEMLRVLLENGTKLHETGALRAAAEHGNTDAVKTIFEMKGDEVELEETDYICDFTSTRYPEVTALYKAAAEGHAEIVDILIRNGADIGFRDVHGRHATGRSVIDVARENGHQALAFRLEQLMSLDPIDPFG
ncbi:MAG: hypothetical protein Q9174_005351 [Haloplaca sp. 1 TL-2023]